MVLSLLKKVGMGLLGVAFAFGSVQAAERTSVTIKLSRTHWFESRNIGMRVYLDDRYVTKMKDSEDKEIRMDEVEVGEHSLRLAPDLFGISEDSWNVEVLEGEDLEKKEVKRKTQVGVDEVIDVKIGAKSGGQFGKIYFTVRSKTDKLLDSAKNRNVVSVVLDPKVKYVVVKESPPIKLARGTEKTVEDTVRVVHSVTVSEGWSASNEVRARVNAGWIGFEGGIRSEIERSTSKTYGTETERRRTVTLRGDSNQGPVKVVWVDAYRTGRARIKVNGEDVEVPFEFREDFDLLTRDAETP